MPRFAWILVIAGFALSPRPAAAEMACPSDMALLSREVLASPRNEKLWGDFGRCATQQQNWKVAHDVAQSALKKHPSLVRPRALLGLSLLQDKKYTEAVAEFTKASQIDPKYVLPHYYLAICYMSLGQRDRALQSAQEAVRLAPKAAENQRLLAGVYMSLQKPSLARAAAFEAVRLAPKEADNYVVVGQVEASEKHNTEAANAYHRALSLQPGNSAAQDGLNRLPATPHARKS